MLADAGALDSLVVTDPAEAAAIWRIREDGAGLAARTSDGRPAHAGWEDAAVPPERLGAYLREFEALLDRARPAGRALRPLRRRLRARADRLPVRRRPRTAAGRGTAPSSRTPPGWSPGTAARCPASTATAGPAASCCRSCTPPPSIGLFERVKARVRPGRRAQPRRARAPGAAGRRRPGGRRAAPPARAWPWPTGTTAATSPPRCTAAPASASAGPTCRRRRRDVPVVAGHPGGEGHHPRPGPGAAGDARARRPGPRLALARGARRARPVPVLQGLLPRLPDRRRHGDLQGRGAAPVLPAPAAPALALHAGPAAALGRPRRPGAPGWSTRVLRLAARRPAGEVVGRAWTSAATCRRSRRGPSGSSGPAARRRPADGAPVALWVDSFTDHFAPEVALAAARVLEAAGYRVQVPGDDTCCGLTWITTGQLDAARTILGATVATLAPLRRRGHPGRRRGAVVHRRAARRRARAASAARTPSGSPRGTRTLAELLAGTPGLGAAVAWPGWRSSPSRTATTPSVLGWSADAALLARAGARGHPARRLLRAGRQLGRGARPPRRVGGDRRAAAAARRPGPGPDAVVLADGFSCRTQLDQLAGRRGLHLAELLAARLP